ncbi:alpha/beta fold hydrolase [Planotetraspora mira]|uniref:Alpha/beta hydrolase n=1 Tax=Planotetraspora mira TaxID=58121 RepID=A0A8J3TUA6_9ACTN|nr:alpha/beta hydrolase [Planotetraspora mira]GII32638.1 hypothetical protein Pmi06nite_60800 [Planotetraspora mira]
MPGKRALIALLLLLTGCGGTVGGTVGASSPPSLPGTPTATATPSASLTGPNLQGCYGPADGRLFTYDGGGVTFGGLIMGDGPVGVVVSYERGGDACTWRPLAERLTSAGYRVLLYERGLSGPVNPLIVKMTERLRKDGAERVFLVGGSIGGSESIVAATKLKEPPVGVVNLAGTVIPEETAPLTAPLLQITAENDSGATPITLQAAGDAAVKSPDRSLIVAKGEFAHASALFGTAQGPMVLDAIMAFLAKHSG